MPAILALFVQKFLASYTYGIKTVFTFICLQNTIHITIMIDRKHVYKKSEQCGLCARRHVQAMHVDEEKACRGDNKKTMNEHKGNWSWDNNHNRYYSIWVSRRVTIISSSIKSLSTPAATSIVAVLAENPLSSGMNGRQYLAILFLFES